MADQAERRRIAHDVYTITGVLVPEDDPIVLAALFYAQKLRDAAGDAAGQLTAASVESRAVVTAAVAAIEQATANNKALADAFDARFQKGIRQVLKNQATPGSGITLTIRHLFGAFAAGAAVVILALSFASGFSYSWMSDAAMGRAFNRVSPDLDPALRAKVLEQLKKKLSS